MEGEEGGSWKGNFLRILLAQCHWQQAMFMNSQINTGHSGTKKSTSLQKRRDCTEITS